MLTDIIIVAVLILINGFFSAAELGTVSVNYNKIKIKATEGNKKSKLIKKYVESPEDFLSTTQITISFISFFLGAYTVQSFEAPITQLLSKMHLPVNSQVMQPIIVLFITLILTYFTLIFGELVPKKLALINSEKTANVSIYVVHFLATIFKPFVRFLSFSTNLVIKILGVSEKTEDEDITEEEIRMLVDEGNEKGNIDIEEAEMINNVFEFNDKTAEEVATHRVDIVALDVNASFDKIIDIAANERYSRIPVYEDNIDHIVGVLHIKDIMKFLLKHKNNETKNIEFDIRKILRKPNFVPTSKKTHDLFNEMKAQKTHLSIIIDEYGGTLGIVTMEDLIEEVMGNIFDEYDSDEISDIVPINENSYIIAGNANLDEVNQQLELNLPIDEYETISGFIMGLLGRIPSESEKIDIEFNNLIFTISEVSEKRIKKVILIKKDKLIEDKNKFKDEKNI